MSTRTIRIALILIFVCAVPASARAATALPTAGLGGSFGFGDALVGRAPVGAGPSLLAVDPATHTVYVANGNNDNGPNAGGDTVSVIDTRDCNAADAASCPGPWPTITVGNLPSAVAVDKATDTVFVTNAGDDTVSVFNGATCNASDSTGCGQTPAEIPVGAQPIGLAIDPANQTVYVADIGTPPFDGTVSMIDIAGCTGTHLNACPTSAAPTVNVLGTPTAVTVDRENHTVYATTFGRTQRQNGWTVFDADTCNATVRSGCGSLGSLIGDPNGPNDGAVDAANDTLYTANYDNTISAYNLDDCDAADLTGCATDAPGTVTFPPSGFEHALYVVVDQPLHSVYVSFQADAALVVVDTRACNGADPSGCAALTPPTVDTGADPEGVVLDRSTQTLYTADEVDDDVSVIAANRCDAANTTGCRHPAPSVPIPGPGAIAVDDAVHTAYVQSETDSVSMIDTDSCRAGHKAGCGHAPPSFTAGTYGEDIAVNPATHTVYVANAGAGSTGTVSVIDDQTCNTTVQTGCGDQQTLQVPGGNAVGLALDPITDTVYVGTDTSSGPNLISVFNGATCNAGESDGCDQTPATMPVGSSGASSPYIYGLDLAVNAATDTLYASNNPFSEEAGDDVYVFNAAICDATDTGGCDQTPATVTVGYDPANLAVDPSTDTIYTVVHADGDYAASVAVIDGATCNGTDTSGCAQAPAESADGFGALGVGVDPATHEVFTANLQDSSVSVIDGATCNATDASGCGTAPAADAVGDYPFALAVDGSTGTVYVSTIDEGVSVLPEQPTNHPAGLAAPRSPQPSPPTARFGQSRDSRGGW